MKVEFYRHGIGEAEIAELLDTLRGVFLSTGPKTGKFEEALAQYLGLKGAVGSTSWTQIAFLVLKAWDIGPGDEVIMPPMTFISCPNIALYCGAKPVFADVDSDTGNLNPDAVRKAITPRTRVILPVHLYGQMADMKSFRAIADSHKLKILEDCAHGPESERDGYRSGHLGDAACFSFYATKNMTSGEGGAVASNDLTLLDRIRVLRLHGMNKSAVHRYSATYQHWDMEALGYKANMSDIQAALLLPQFATMEAKWKRKDEISRYYESRFSAAGIEFPRVLPGSKSARHLFTIWAPRGRRDEVLKKLQDAQIGVAVNFRAVHLLKYYRETFGFKPGDYPVAEEIGDRTITIPLYPKLTDSEVEYVADQVIQAVGARTS